MGRALARIEKKGIPTFTVARQHEGRIVTSEQPVRFTIVRPGDTLLAGTKRPVAAAQ